MAKPADGSSPPTAHSRERCTRLIIKPLNKLNLSEDQLFAVQAYVKSSIEDFTKIAKVENLYLDPRGFTFQLNAALRANLQFTKETTNFLALLDTAIKASKISEKIVVYRACNYLEMTRYISGGRFVDLGYMSTSLTIDSTQRFFEKPKLGYRPAFLTITIPRNSRVIMLNEIDEFDNNTYEDEVLFSRKSVFDVLIDQPVPTDGIEETIGRQVAQDFTAIQILELTFREYLH